MKRVLICLVMLMPISETLAAKIVPDDVQHFIDKREGCDHMRGEIPEHAEKERMREINREICKLCAGTDKELKKLKQKYAADPVIMQVLDEYEPDIEALENQLPKNRNASDK